MVSTADASWTFGMLLIMCWNAQRRRWKLYSILGCVGTGATHFFRPFELTPSPGSLVSNSPHIGDVGKSLPHPRRQLPPALCLSELAIFECNHIQLDLVASIHCPMHVVSPLRPTMGTLADLPERCISTSCSPPIGHMASLPFIQVCLRSERLLHTSEVGIVKRVPLSDAPMNCSSGS